MQGWFAGDPAPRALFLPFVRPKMLRIMASMHQRDSCPRRTGKLDYLGDDFTMFPYAAECLDFSVTCYASAYGALVVFYIPWTVTCSEFASGVQDYGFSGRWHPGLFPYSAPVGSTLDTCLRQFLEACGSDCKTAESPQLQFIFGRRHSLRDAEADFLGLFSRPKFPQLPFIDEVFDVPLVQVHMSSLSRRRG